MNDEIVHYWQPNVMYDTACCVFKVSKRVRISTDPRDVTCGNCFRTSTFKRAAWRQDQLGGGSGRHDKVSDDHLRHNQSRSMGKIKAREARRQEMYGA